MRRQNRTTHTHIRQSFIPIPYIYQKGPKSIINNLLSINYSVGNGLGGLLLKVAIGAGIPSSVQNSQKTAV